ncbi:hypothetical protein GCM10027275_14850 [Rhabdobacter roseus]|uniref:AraC family transcriptional regulator n=1 Tax=Rhabdobacter roseus TaxID=1655419 RepID=A0A840TKE0_9BACT|nr:GyrI-like domain-containing protein [Rhabdobacter roseus]MBB5283405.1 AraC family transcriptional regulator [Rhabdobacter roseus]
MKSTPTILNPTRFVPSQKPLLVAGLSQDYPYTDIDKIPLLWQEFVPYLGHIPGQQGGVTYGLCFDQQGGVKYLCGVEVASTEGLPVAFTYEKLPAYTYAVFTHDGPLSTLCHTIEAIGSVWLPQADYEKAAGANCFFERYGEAFDPETGTGDLEVWVPVQPKTSL